MLVIPLKNHENELIGVLQLLNRKDETTGEVSVFSPVDEEVTRSLASQAAVTLTNVILVQDLENLLMAFIKSIASAIDKMSPYTGDHIRRVADIATLIAEKLNSTEQGRELLKKHKKTPFSKDEIEQIRIAALMHDVGKITTPVHVIDKSTKLETIYDRLHFVLAKLEILKRDKHIAYLEDRITKQQLGKFLDNIEHNVKFLRETNMGSELMSSEHVQHLDYIAKDTIMLDGKKEAILNENELVNLQIRKGTLTIAERDKINEHANLSLEMLEALPYPKKLRRVPEIGGNHHEQLNGKGYPRGLNADELSIEARLMAIADIFEALSSSDRPYKTEKTLSQCFDILEVKAKANEIDADLVKFIVEEGLHLEYAKKELMPHQIDDVTLNL
jgi:HD-GYP domain-containing protein (c-di-GMP phosphodiesterase class II)